MPKRDDEYYAGRKEPGIGLCPYCGNLDVGYIKDEAHWHCRRCDKTFISPSYGPGGKLDQSIEPNQITPKSEEITMVEAPKENIFSKLSKVFKKETPKENLPEKPAPPESPIQQTPRVPYVAEISRRNPSCILIMIDQSNSMNDPFGNDTVSTSKASFVADAVNGVLNELIVQNQRGTVVNRFYVGLLGYGDHVGSAFNGTLSRRDLVPLDELQQNPAHVQTRLKKESDGAGGYFELEVKFPTWVTPVADGMTPMCRALKQAKEILTQFVEEHPDCFPPIVLNITDGEATDGDPSVKARLLTQVQSNDGNVLLFNLHCSSAKGLISKFPTNENGLDAEFGKLLLYMSSKLPPIMLEKANSRGYAIPEGARGFVFNSGIADVVDFLKIGTTMSAQSASDAG
jgi:hypothetical protein